RQPGEPVMLGGTVMRVDPDTGAGLPDNPLFGSPDANARRIVAYGLRNPFRFALRPNTREVWVGDVGWNTTEEINRMDVAAGAAVNFGWPCYEGAALQPGYHAAGLASCQALEAEGSARPPYFSYDHVAHVVAGEACPIGTSSVTGLAFYTAGTYPAAFHNALFFTDWARRCIWAMLPDATGTPGASQVVTFAVLVGGGAVNLERGPGGDIFYVDHDRGRIARIAYFAGNQPPVAVATATPSNGASPLAVQFDASASSDPEGGPLTYGWDFDEDDVFTDSTLVDPTFTFNTSGKHTVRVLVRDSQGATSTASVSVIVDNQSPRAAIDAPVSSLTWR